MISEDSDNYFLQRPPSPVGGPLGFGLHRISSALPADAPGSDTIRASPLRAQFMHPHRSWLRLVRFRLIILLFVSL